MLKNVQEIMSGDVTHAAEWLWYEELSEAEAAAIHARIQSDPNYREDLDALLSVLAAMEGLANERAVEAIARDYRQLLRVRRAKRRLALGMAAGILAALGAALAVFSPWRGAEEGHLQKYFTRIGEQQTIALPDGSVVTLNTGGELMVDFGGAARRVLLERGEAYFEVAELAHRPFTVDLGSHAVTALGTAFNIRKDPDRYQVAVTRGAVVVHEDTEDLSALIPPVSIAGRGPLRVDAGWVAEFDVGGNLLTAFRPESIDRYHDWRSGLLSFSYEPLSEVVQELNRYSRRKILIEDASVMELSVVTAIRVTDIDAALYGLETVLPIEVTRHYDRIVITASTEASDQDERAVQ